MFGFEFSPDKRIDNSQNSSGMLLFLLFLLLLLTGLWTLNFTSGVIEDRRADLGGHFFLIKQLCYLGVGAVGFGFCALLDYKIIKRFLPVLLVVTFVCCVLVIMPGIRQNRNGAYRWLYIGVFKLQVSELVKFFIILYLANFFDKKQDTYLLSAQDISTQDVTADFLDDSNDTEDAKSSPTSFMTANSNSTLGAWVVLLVFCLLVYVQNDLSTTFFIFLVGTILIFVFGEKKRLFLGVLLVAVPFLLLFIMSKSYRLNRTIAFLAHFRNPDFLKDSVNYQPAKSIDAIINGGLMGQGTGSNLTSSYSVPELHTDYIFAGFAEATGFLGVILFFALCIVTGIVCYKISFGCKNRFLAFCSFGFTTLLLCQTLLNIGVACAALPSTGITLPLFSFGGSSLVVSMMMFGIIMNATKYVENKKRITTIDSMQYINAGDFYE